MAAVVQMPAGGASNGHVLDSEARMFKFADGKGDGMADVKAYFGASSCGEYLSNFLPPLTWPVGRARAVAPPPPPRSRPAQPRPNANAHPPNRRNRRLPQLYGGGQFKETFTKDLVAGVTVGWRSNGPPPPAPSRCRAFPPRLRSPPTAASQVGCMLVPQSMAYALLAGMLPIDGLYAASIPLFIYPFFGTSRVQSVGPVVGVGPAPSSPFRRVKEARVFLPRLVRGPSLASVGTRAR